MSSVAGALRGTRAREAGSADRSAKGEDRSDALLCRAEPLAAAWAEQYDTAWAIDAQIARDAAAWSTDTAGDLLRRLRAPNAQLAVRSSLLLVGGTGMLWTVLLLLPQLGAPAASLLAAPGVVVSALGMRLAVRCAAGAAQLRAAIPPLRPRLQAELLRHALAAVDRRRDRLAGPRRPVPRHAFSDLLPVHTQNIAAAWMRHLGELDATVVRPSDSQETTPARLLEQPHVRSSGYVARVWSSAAETPELELGLLEDAAGASGTTPLLFSLSGFPPRMIAHANRRGIALFTYSPWTGTLSAHGAAAERCLRRGLRDAGGMIP
jgi:hypothetical protein